MSEQTFEDAYGKAFPADAPTQTTSSQSLATTGSTSTPAPGTYPGSVPYASAPTTPGTTPTGASGGRRDWDPYPDHNFVVEIDGIMAGAFQKCDGLSFEVEPIEYKDSMDAYPRYRPGIRRFGRIKLTKGYVGNTALWSWCESIMRGNSDRRHGAIHLYEEDGDTPAVSYRFIDAWPVKWSGFQFDGQGRSTLVEEIELVTECVIKGW